MSTNVICAKMLPPLIEFEGCSAPIALGHGQTVSIYDASTCLTLISHKLTNDIKVFVVDFEFIEDLRSFVVILSDGAIITTPVLCTNIENCAKSQCLDKPESIRKISNTDVMIMCANGHILHINLSKDNSIPLILRSPKCTHTHDSWGIANQRLHLVSRQINEIEILFANINTIGASVPHCTWLDMNTLPGTSRTYVSVAGSVSTQLHSHDDIGVLSLLITTSTQDNSKEQKSKKSSKKQSVSSSPESSPSSRWLVLDSRSGAVQFERQLSEAVSAAVSSVCGMLWLLSGQSLTAWCTRFGTPLHTVTVNWSCTGSPIALLIGSSNSYNGVYTCTLIRAQEQLTDGPLCTVTASLHSSSSSSNLISALGKLKTSNLVITNTVVAPTAVVETTGPTTDVLRGMSRGLKRKLQQVQTQLTDKQREDEEEFLSVYYEPLCSLALLKRARAVLLYGAVPLSVSSEAAQMFLSRLQAVQGDVHVLRPSDWSTVLLLLRAGVVSVTLNNWLLRQAAAAGRVDVLASIAEHVKDLTERQAVSILVHCMSLTAAELKCLVVAGGVLRWEGTKVAGESVAVQPQATPDADSGGSKKKSKKSKKGEPEPAVTLSSSSSVAATATGTGKVAGAHGRTALPADECCAVTSSLTAVRAVCECLLHREAAFSSCLLTEALRSVNSSQALLLLRVYVHCLRCLNMPQDNHSTVTAAASRTHLRVFKDEQVKRACAWTAALIDCHFSAIAMNAVSHAPTRLALKSVLECVSKTDQALDLTETLSGVWSHVARSCCSAVMSESSAPPTGLYRLEYLQF